MYAEAPYHAFNSFSTPQTEADKPGFDTAETDVKKVSSQSPEITDLSTHSPWHPGFWSRFPLKPFFALLFALAAAMVMIFVLARSNGQVANWRVSPPVLLAISAAVSNILIRYAQTKGVTIAWWVKAMREGTQMKDLHETWAMGNSFDDALFSGTAFNFVALASIAVSLLPINGPLLQRASFVSSVVQTGDVNITIPMAQQFPDGYSGIITGRGGNVSVLTSNFTSVVAAFNANVPQNLTDSGCRGRCSGTVKTIGYAINCTSSTQAFNISYEALNRTALEGPPFFAATFSYYEPFNYSADFVSNYAAINFSSIYKDIDTCAGNLQIRNCTIVPALLQQNIILENNTISLDPAFSYTSDIVHSLLPTKSFLANTRGAIGVPSTHGGMALYLATRYNSAVNTIMDGVYGLNLKATGISQFDYMKTQFTPGGGDNGCNVTWSDPTEDLLAGARELAFRVALNTANPSNATNLQPLLNGIQARNVLVYRSNFTNLGIALIFTLLGFFCVLPTFFGWWRMGRTVSMSPLEIAKAFGVAKLEGVDSNAKASKLLKDVGSVSVRYGAVGSSVEKEMLLMSEPDHVSVPSRGTVFK
jgi:hypothetical protein